MWGSAPCSCSLLRGTVHSSGRPAHALAVLLQERDRLLADSSRMAAEVERIR